MKAGVKIAFGTDAGGFSWDEPMAQEFSRMTEFGMSPMDAIRSATSRAADLPDMTGQLAPLAPGVPALRSHPSRRPLRSRNPHVALGSPRRYR